MAATISPHRANLSPLPLRLPRRELLLHRSDRPTPTIPSCPSPPQSGRTHPTAKPLTVGLASGSVLGTSTDTSDRSPHRVPSCSRFQEGKTLRSLMDRKSAAEKAANGRAGTADRDSGSTLAHDRYEKISSAKPSQFCHSGERSVSPARRQPSFSCETSDEGRRDYQSKSHSPAPYMPSHQPEHGRRRQSLEDRSPVDERGPLSSSSRMSPQSSFDWRDRPSPPAAPSQQPQPQWPQPGLKLPGVAEMLAGAGLGIPSATPRSNAVRHRTPAPSSLPDWPPAVLAPASVGPHHRYDEAAPSPTDDRSVQLNLLPLYRPSPPGTSPSAATYSHSPRSASLRGPGSAGNDHQFPPAHRPSAPPSSSRSPGFRSTSAFPPSMLPPPRPRVTLACQFCRSRKLRCSQGPGPCEHCSRRGRECVFEANKGDRTARRANGDAADMGGPRRIGPLDSQRFEPYPLEPL